MDQTAKLGNDLSPLQKAFGTISQLKRKIQDLQSKTNEPIAVVGLAARAPMANNADELWRLIANKQHGMREMPADRFDVDNIYDPRPGLAGKTYTRQAGFLDHVDQFDAAFFGISAREAEGMDPQQRMLLEVTWHALEDAGILASGLKGSATGVYVGVTASDYGYLQAQANQQAEVNPYFNTGVPLNACAGRISYVFGLQGPSMAIDTACSSSLTAIHLACQALRAGECDLALAGGVNLTLSPLLYVTLSAAGMMSADGQCKTFAASADGYARGEGCGMIVLKRLSKARRDGDRILGLIRGSAVNQDGASSGLTVPNGVAQQQLIQRTLTQAGVAAHEIDYVEAHGTGTPLGDPIEARALGCVLGQSAQRQVPLKVGSIKSNIGHLESAAGVMGVIKVLLALRHNTLPATLHLNERNANIDWTGLKLEPVVDTTEWPHQDGRTRLASVSAFGASGSNAHLVIEEGPTAPTPSDNSANDDLPLAVLPLSAKNPVSLAQLARGYQALDLPTDLSSLKRLCALASTRRDMLAQRAAIVCKDAAALKAALAALANGQTHPDLITQGSDQNTRLSTQRTTTSRTRVAFLFTGQGGVYRGMGKSLYDQFAVYREAIDQCAMLCKPHLDADLLEALGYALSPAATSTTDLSNQTELTQPALFAVQYALAKLWVHLGVKPTAVQGHSIGEFAAACVAGALTLDDAMPLVIKRAKLMADLPIHGGMLAVRAEPTKIRETLQSCEAWQQVDIAVLNGQHNTVLSGNQACLTACQSLLKSAGIDSRSLDVTHGFHCALMDPMLESLADAAGAVTLSRPNMTYVSSLLGRPLQPDEDLDAQYWRRHCREPVQFDLGLQHLLDDGLTHFIEIGPGQVLTALGLSCESDANWVSSISPRQDDPVFFTRAVAQGFVGGLQIRWPGTVPTNLSNIKLPLYPFDRKHFWFAQTDVASIPNAPRPTFTDASATMTIEQINQQQQATVSKLCELFAGLLRLSPEAINPKAQLVEMGADSLVLVSGVNAIENEFGIKLEIRQFFEEITTLDAIAAYLNQRKPPAAAAAAPEHLPTPPAIAPVVPPPMVPIANALPSIPTPGLSPGAGQDTLSQLILAQTQLMSQHLALLSGAPQAAAVVAQPTQTPAHQPTIQATAKVGVPAVTQSVPVVSEDRSSPLKALNNPITPTAGGLTEQQQAHLQALISRYQKRTATSKKLAQESRAQLADSRASVGFRFSTKEILYPISGAQSNGSRLIDVDNNEYVDLTMGFGVLLFGSKPAHMNGVIEREVEHGFRLGPRLDIMQEVAELFCGMTGHDRVAFTNSGTEAVMIALRLARAATGRDKIVIFEGAYNGHSDATLAKTVRNAQGEISSEPVAPGIPKNVAKDCLVLEYGNPESLQTIREHAHEIGAVLVEPVQSRNLTLQPVEFVKSLRALTTELDIGLIFDEMISGFRAHQGGIQALWGVKADLATYGKIIGGGTPIGAVAGSSRFMDGIDGGVWQYGDQSYPKAQRTYFGGTFCQHPISMAGCLATLRELKRQGNALQQGLTQRTSDFAKTLNDYFVEEQIELRVIHFTSTFSFRFPGNLEIFYYHLLEKGVYIWEWRACFLSTAHTDEDLAFVINAIKETIQDMRAGGFLPPSPSGAPPKIKKPKESQSLKSHAMLATKVSTHQATSNSKSSCALSFGLYFFGNYDADFSANKYELLMQGCRYADANGFDSVWLPERHFDKFGGFSPNPSVLAAALARETSHIALRAGSVVMPLHHPLRVAEEWALVDNLSNGRVGIAFASGWHPNDFALAPDNYRDNREVTFTGVQTVRQLWRGESVEFQAGDQQKPHLSIYPRPKQSELPAWLTVVGNPDTYRKAGEIGVGILTNLLGQSLEDLETNIQVYLSALKANGHDHLNPRITVLVHTFMGEDAEQAVETARQPMCDYLLSSLSLFQKMAQSLPPNLRDIDKAAEADKAYIVGKAYERYVAERALIGSPQTCQPMVDRLQAMGVTEIACFVDFGVAATDVMHSLPIVKNLMQANQVTPEATIRTHPLSEAQRQLWLIAQMNSDGRQAYMDPGHARIEGPIDIDTLERSLSVVIARHESLRSTIDDTGLTQHVSPPREVVVSIVDLSQTADPEQAVQDWIKKQMEQPIDLSVGPLFQPYLLRLTPTHHVLSLFAHHIISDGPSMGVIIGELMSLLGGVAQNDLPTAMPYREFVSWQNGQRQSPSMRAHERYWLDQFASLPQDLALPLDKPRPSTQTWHGNRLRMTCPSQTGDTIRAVAADHGCTPYMVLLGVYSALLHRVTEQSEITIGAAYSGRGLPGSQAMVGYGVHLLPILSRADRGANFAEHLQQVKETLLQAYAHQDYPFAWLMNQLPLKRDPARPPLLATIFNYEKLPTHQTVGELQVSPYFGSTPYSRVDLTLTVNHVGSELILEADYNTSLFSASTIDRLLRSYLQLLDSLHLTPKLPLSQTSLLSAIDQAASLKDFNDVATPKTEIALHQLIEQQAQLHPDALAVRVYEDELRSLSFATLNARANQLAHHLLDLGAGPDQRVGVCLERTPDLLVALLACLKSGVAYVPMDPDYPTARLQYLVGDAQLSILIATQPIIDHTALTCDTIVLLDQHCSRIEEYAADNLQKPHHPDQLAYVIYTSGSTGQPKGTMICHGGLSNYVQWAVGAYAADQGDGSPVLGSVGFDATITSLFVPLAAGKPTVLMPQGQALEALDALSKTADQYSFIKITPAHLEILNSLRERQPKPNRALAKYLVLGGEALPGAYLEPWFEQSATRGINEYGPTETVVGCCTYLAQEPCTGTVPIGRPIAGTRLYVLDEYLNPVLPGMPGELYIGGAGVARGYLNRPAQSAAAFVPDPFSGIYAPAGARLYKTGDLVKAHTDGTLIFLGRIDSQIKLHGFRIEPGEVEAALTDLPHVREALVIKHQEPKGQAMLVAYVTTNTTAPASDPSAQAHSSGYQADELIEQLRDKLPAHQVPSRIMILAQMPLTSHGKIDRSKLPEPSVPSKTAKPITAQTPVTSTNTSRHPVAQVVAAVWCKVLNRTNINPSDNFFDLGGNSLLLLEAHRQLQDVLPANCQVIDLFRYPTITALAKFLQGHHDQKEQSPKPLADDTETRVARQLAARKRQPARPRRTRPSAA